MLKKCPKCSSFALKKNGNNRVGNHRLKCKDCGYCFVERRKRKQEIISRSNHWFEKYITEGYSIRQISEQRKILEYRVRRDIQYRLDTNQIDCIDEIYPDVYHIID